MKVSVIIPVYNAGEFLRDSVSSALKQTQTGEVLLIEDRSDDNSAQICTSLNDTDDRIKYFQHESNLGAAEARNTGIKNASYKYISFLDADDIYLDNRFDNAEYLFDKHQEIDGVYEAVGTLFESDELKQKWNAKSRKAVTSLKKPVPPHKLFDTLIFGRKGSFLSNGVTLKRSAFDKTGFFEKKLRLSQDTHLWLKMAAVNKFIPGDLIKPVALRRIHKNNRYFNADKEYIFIYQKLLWETLLVWSVENNIDYDKKVNIEFMKNFHDIFRVENNENIYTISNYLKCTTNFILHNNLRKSLILLKKLIIR